MPEEPLKLEELMARQKRLADMVAEAAWQKRQAGFDPTRWVEDLAKSTKLIEDAAKLTTTGAAKAGDAKGEEKPKPTPKAIEWKEMKGAEWVIPTLPKELTDKSAPAPRENPYQPPVALPTFKPGSSMEQMFQKYNAAAPPPKSVEDALKRFDLENRAIDFSKKMDLAFRTGPDGKRELDVDKMAAQLQQKLEMYQKFKANPADRFWQEHRHHSLAGSPEPWTPKPALTAIGRLERNPQLQFGLLVGVLVCGLLCLEGFRKLRRTVSKLGQHQHQLAAWLLFLPLISLTFLAEPEHEDPSHLITFAAGTQLFSLILLWGLPRVPKAAPNGAVPRTQYLSPKDHPGDSPEFALLLSAALATRAACTTHYQGYLPTDATGDGCYQVIEALSALVALRGLVRLGIYPAQALSALAVAACAALLAYECHGELDANTLADTAWAASVYAEAMSWYFICRNVLRAGASRRVDAGFLLPACAQVLLRTVFWFLAAEEVAPARPVRASAAFPDVLLGTHVALSAALVLTTLLVYLHVPVPASVAEAAVELQKLPERAEPLLGQLQKNVAAAVAVAAGDLGESSQRAQCTDAGPLARADLKPVRAVYEGGKVSIEYGPA